MFIQWLFPPFSSVCFHFAAVRNVLVSNEPSSERFCQYFQVSLGVTEPLNKVERISVFLNGEVLPPLKALHTKYVDKNSKT